MAESSKKHTARVERGFVHEDYGRGPTVREATATERLLGAEIERLTRELHEHCDAWQANLAAYSATNDRLRAALERIVALESLGGWYIARCNMLEIAREALAGQGSHDSERQQCIDQSSQVETGADQGSEDGALPIKLPVVPAAAGRAVIEAAPPPDASLPRGVTESWLVALYVELVNFATDERHRGRVPLLEGEQFAVLRAMAIELQDRRAQETGEGHDSK